MRHQAFTIMTVLWVLLLAKNGYSQTFDIDYQQTQSSEGVSEKQLLPGSTIKVDDLKRQVTILAKFSDTKSSKTVFSITSRSLDSLGSENFLDHGEVYNLWHEETQQKVVLKREDDEDGEISLILYFVDLSSVVVYRAYYYPLDSDEH